MDEEKRNDIPVRISTILHILSISLVYFRFNPIPLSPRYLSNLPVSFSPHPRAREAFLRSNRARACGPIAFIKAQCHRTRYLRPPCTRTYSLEVSAASIGNRSRRVSPPSAPLISMKFEEFGMGKRDDEGGEPRKYDRGG